MNLRSAFALTLVVLLSAACATVRQETVPLESKSIGLNSGRIGVAMAPLPKVDTEFPGAGCLLCIAAASMANSALTEHSHSLSYEDLPDLKSEVGKLLRNGGANIVVIDEPMKIDELPDFGTKAQNIARKDFSQLRQKYGIDKLLVIDITTLGFVRTYSSYFPTSDPKSTIKGTGFLVNLKNNAYEWYQPVDVTVSAADKWDEPPKYPGLTNAFYQALEMAKDDIRRPFATGAVAVSGATDGSPVQTTASAAAR